MLMIGINMAWLLIWLPLCIIGCGLCCKDSDNCDNKQEAKRDKEVIANDTKITQNDKIVQKVVNQQKNKKNKCGDYVLSRNIDNDLDKGHGLRNLSNTCYMNAVMQCLLHTKGYTEWVKSKNWEEDLEENKDQNHNNIHEGIGNLENKNGNNSNLNSQLKKVKIQKKINYQLKQLILQYGDKNGVILSCDKLVKTAEPCIQSLFGGYNGDIDGPSNTENMVKEVPRTSQKNIWQRILDWFLGFFSVPQVQEETFGRQHDATDFLFNFLHISCNCDSEAYTGFQWISREDCIRECQLCNFKKQYFGYDLPENIISLCLLQDETQFCSLEGLLKKRFLVPEESFGVDCVFCEKKSVTVTKKDRMDIADNKYLIFFLGRFGNDRQLNRQFHIDKQVIFPQVLDLNNFVTDRNKDKAKYSLYAVVYHSGGLNGGHYMAACKHDNNWILYNDSQVSVINRFRILETSSSSNLSEDDNKNLQMPNAEDIDNQNPLYISKYAYVLFYEKLEQDDLL